MNFNPTEQTFCILGAGQLGKMSLVAAREKGFRTMVWAPQEEVAMEMATYRLIRPYTDPIAFDEVVRNASVVTTEWENIPLDLTKKLEARGVKVRPSSRVLEVAQSRFKEKSLAKQLYIPITPTIVLPAGTVVDGNTWDVYLPGIVKTDKLGYDGKGQWSVSTPEEVNDALAKAGVDCVLEKQVDFIAECSILVARSPRGGLEFSDVVKNTHRNGILDTSYWNGRETFASPGLDYYEIAEDARRYATLVAEHLELEGILVLEFFVTANGTLLFNEMAPRPHNSFHSSIETAYTSQFEQHIRAICDLPLGKVRFYTPFKMRNLIGGTWEEDWAPHLTKPHRRLHLYGKAESRPGRKMGHVTEFLPRK